MKNVFKQLAILGVLLSASGCLHEKYDECPMDIEEYNVSLEFFLSDGNGGCKFLSDVSSVDLAIYDNDGNNIEIKNITRPELTKYKGVEFTLPSGTYHVVAWANITGNTKYDGINGTAHPYGPHVTYNGIVSGHVGNADKVFYAPLSGGRSRATDMPGCYTMTVAPATGHSGKLEFKAAYRTLKVYVEGYNGTPEIEIADVPWGLTWFGMGGLTDENDAKLTVITSQVATPQEREGVLYDIAVFDTFWFDENNDIVLRVIDKGTGYDIFATTLNEILEEAEDPTEIVISIVLKFGPAGAEIYLPDWHREETNPGIGH